MDTETVTALVETVEKSRARAAEDPSRLSELADALTRLGVAYNNQGEFPDAVATIEEAADTWRRVGSAKDLAASLATLSGYYAAIGLDDEAAAAAEESAEFTQPGRE